MNEILIKHPGGNDATSQLPEKFNYIIGWAKNITNEDEIKKLLQSVDYLQNDNPKLFKIVINIIRKNLSSTILKNEINLLLDKENKKENNNIFLKVVEILKLNKIRVNEEIINILSKSIIELQNKPNDRSLWIKAFKGDRCHKFFEIKKYANGIYFRIFFYYTNDGLINITDIKKRSDKKVFDFREDPPFIIL